MTVEEALHFFENIPPIRRKLQTLYDVGLGYVQLGQPATTLSGGEAQRVKLASELQRRSTGRTFYILDEPTTGLHFDDVRQLLIVLQRLVDGGNTVLVIEHNLDVIKSADRIIDLGPEGGDRGGEIVVAGTPEEVAACDRSHTGRFLAPVLAGRGASAAPELGEGHGISGDRPAAAKKRAPRAKKASGLAPAMAADYPTIAEQVASAPDAPGVYLWKDAAGEVLYVGKAKSLRKRMRQYTSGHDEREKIPLMMEQVASFDYVVTSTEVESLVLEKNLIKQFKPPYNVDYRDDKSYPFIALTLDDPFPAIKFTREKHKPGTRYFGPYTDARAARETDRHRAPHRADLPRDLRRVEARHRPRRRRRRPRRASTTTSASVPGPCVGAITREEYAENVAPHRALPLGQARRPRGRTRAPHARGRRRARLRARRALPQPPRGGARDPRRQKVVSARPLEFDVIGFFREETVAGVHVFVVREGRVLFGNEFVLDKGLDVPLPELVEGFLLRYYADGAADPARDRAARAARGRRDASRSGSRRCAPSAPHACASPSRSARERRDLLALAEDNARHTLMRFKVRTRYDEERLNAALLQLESALALPAPPLRIECFDISTLHGTLLGRLDGRVHQRPRRLEELPALQGPARHRRGERRRDDGGGAAPPLRARAHGRRPLRQASRPRHRRRRQAAAHGGARGARRARARATSPVVGLAKREEELFVTWADAARRAAHRLAVALPRQARARRGAPLRDRVPPRPARQGDDRERARRHRRASARSARRRCSRRSARVKKLREATADEIAAVPGIPRDLAEEIVAVLHA